ncbi:thioredoxin-like protein [Amylocarpus encephaloides]|uniref:thioredoxin-dependent peroxiredoxin n=1 Tax=Amylocarpus encephaloides TaxID=45428 RepID=A0A9P7YMX8_9HELO|nr:thioredoxin-like protein [Amylocarpus encephaloides]
MSLSAQLSAVLEGFSQKAPPDVVKVIRESVADFDASFQRDLTIKPGQKLPPFNLSDALGNQIRSDELLARGPLLITFYRGEWCPYCNLALRALQQHLDEFTAKGVTLVGISPSLPNSSLSMTEKNDLKFQVLSDVRNEYAKELGILFPMPDSLRPVFAQFGNDMKAFNGDDSFEVPVPATFLVDREGVVRNAFIETDYSKRVEPSTVLGWIDSLGA